METALFNPRTNRTNRTKGTGRSTWSHLKQTLQLTPTTKVLITTVALMFIAAVSMHDTYLAVIEEEILLMEKNPICVDLIRLDPEGLTFFILGKCIGTLAVIGTLAGLHWFNYTHAKIVTAAVALFQAFLLGYLHLSDPLMGGLPNFAVLFA